MAHAAIPSLLGSYPRLLVLPDRPAIFHERARTLDAVRARLTPADATDPGRLVACNEQLQVLSAALAELPEAQREAVVLHIHGRMRFRTIAGSLGISVNTVKGRYRYGIRKLRSLFNGEIQT